MIGAASLTAIVLTLLICFGLPCGLLIAMAVKHKLSAASCGMGAVVFVVFALILEGLLNFTLSRSAGTAAIFANPWSYAAYGGLAAGLFEETGRAVAFLLVLKTMRSWEDGISYGVGHAGAEAILTTGLVYINNLVYSLLINTGVFDKSIAPSLPAGYAEQITGALTKTSAWMFLMAGAERIFAFSIQLALSLLVLYGIKKRRAVYWLLAVVIHAAVDFPAGLRQKGILPVVPLELYIMACAAAGAVFIFRSRPLFAKSAETINSQL